MLDRVEMDVIEVHVKTLRIPDGVLSELPLPDAAMPLELPLDWHGVVRMGSESSHPADNELPALPLSSA